MTRNILIVSYKHKMIFLHCRKVAGSSIKVALAPFLGEHDIVIGSWNEIIDSGCPLNQAGHRILAMPKARAFYLAARAIGKSKSEAINAGIKAYYRGKLSINPQHPTAFEVKTYFGDIWDKYFKFAFTRNPFERVVSDYYWRIKMTGKQVEFTEYLHMLKQRTRRRGFVHPGGSSNWEMMSADDRLEMNFVGRYEQLDEDFAKVCELLGLPSKGGVGATEKVNTATREYGALYSEVEKQLVREIFAKELEHFGYEYPY